MLKRTIASVFVAALLCLVALPATALAAAEGAPNSLYVGNYKITSGDTTTYLKAGSTEGSLTEGSADAWTVKYDPSTVTLSLQNANISGDNATTSPPYGAGIYAPCSSNQSVALTIELIGTNTITGSYGIYVNANQGTPSGADASLVIKNGGDNGSLTVTGTGNSGLLIASGTGNASLTINDASVVASSNGSYGCAGVCVQSGASATDSPNISLSVDGGSLTASGAESSDGILFYVGSSQATGATTSLTVSENAIVDAKTGGIKASDSNLNDLSHQIVVGSGTGTSGGIVFDGTEGTVYGNVDLQENLEIGEGESLTIPNGSSLTISNDKTLTVNGGTLTGDVTGAVIYKVTGVSLEKDSLTLEVGDSETLNASITPDNATNKNVTWSSDDEAVATVDANGKVTAVGAGTAIITVTTADGGKTATCTVTVEHDPAGAWSSDADGHWHACEACGDKLDYAGHTPKVEGAHDATCTEEGYTGDTVCSVCDYMIAKGETIPVAGHSYQDGVCTVCGEEEPAKNEDSIPATGDVAPMACALAGLFGIALVAAGLRKRTCR